MDEATPAKNFTAVSRKRKERALKTRSIFDEARLIVTEEYDDLSRRLDRSGIQDSAATRSNLRARRLAEFLLNEKGDIELEKLEASIKNLKEHLHFPLISRLEDSLAQKHLLCALEQLFRSKPTQKLIKQFSHPISHKGAEEVIRQTLDLPSGTIITDNHVRQAALSAWFTYLRQSVGSCFATAPALVIQCQMPDQFLLDLKEMLETGRLKRVSAGQEYHAPISASAGVGDLKKPIILLSEDLNQFREVGTSPGLLAALTAAGVIDPALGLKERVLQTRTETINALKTIDKGAPYFATTAENILKMILLNHLNLDEKRLEEWLQRPRDPVFGGLMIQMPHASVGQKGIGELSAQFMEKFKEAKSAFIRLAENALLKTWEFTVASFAETKADFSRWNLFASLGFDPQEPGGIGECLYKETKEQLDQANRKVQEYQIEYEALYSQLKYAESRVRGASSEKELVWLRAEYQSKYNEFQTFEIMRNREHYLAQRFSTLFSDMRELYLSLFPRYFQEVYDAEVHDVGTGIWDDRPAGFRLLYKHGRMNTSQWSRIDTPNEFSDALASFFSLTESEISHAPHLEGMETAVSELVTRIINHVKTKEFLESSLWRMGGRHGEGRVKNPLENLDKITKKPWAYTLGGNLETLIASYFKLRDLPRETARYIENEMELLVFLGDTLKMLPPKTTEEFAGGSSRRMLMHSPTHAFNLNPGLEPFYSIWQNESYTYTWVRDQLIYPMQQYWESYEMREERYQKFTTLLLPLIPTNFRPRFKQIFSEFPGTMSPSSLSEYMTQRIETDTGLKMGGRPNYLQRDDRRQNAGGFAFYDAK